MAPPPNEGFLEVPLSSLETSLLLFLKQGPQGQSITLKSLLGPLPNKFESDGWTDRRTIRVS